jgi:hypothetical protein
MNDVFSKTKDGQYRMHDGFYDRQGIAITQQQYALLSMLGQRIRDAAGHVEHAEIEYRRRRAIYAAYAQKLREGQTP